MAVALVVLTTMTVVLFSELLDMVVRIRSVSMIQRNGKEEPALAVYYVSDGVDLCRVGFLPKH